jgi:hypothetical protein
VLRVRLEKLILGGIHKKVGHVQMHAERITLSAPRKAQSKISHWVIESRTSKQGSHF